MPPLPFTFCCGVKINIFFFDATALSKYFYTALPVGRLYPQQVVFPYCPYCTASNVLAAANSVCNVASSCLPTRASGQSIQSLQLIILLRIGKFIWPGHLL